jgi:hypothetical protein
MTDLTRVPWRAGTHYSIHLYAGDEPIGTMLTPELAAAAVEAHNAAIEDGTPAHRDAATEGTAPATT